MGTTRSDAKALKGLDTKTHERTLNCETALLAEQELIAEVWSDSVLKTGPKAQKKRAILRKCLADVMSQLESKKKV